MAIGVCDACGRLYMYGGEKVMETRCPRCRRSLRGIGTNEAVAQHRRRQRAAEADEGPFGKLRAVRNR
jgi:phage FluMu protein Com